MSDISAEIWERSGGLGRWFVTWLPGVVAGIATGALAADQGGYFPTSWGWAAVPLCWVAVMALFVRDHIGLSRLELAFLGILLAIPSWAALSLLWTRSLPLTILEVQRDLVYPSAALAVLLVTRRATTRHLLVGVLVAITAVSWYSLAQRLFPTKTPVFDVISTFRLTGPITYWNGLGIYSAVGALVALALASTGRSTISRALAAATLPVLLPTMYLTFSRGAWIAAGAGLIAAVAVAPRRAQVVTALLVLLPVPLAAVVFASQSQALTRLQTSLAIAQTDGHRMAVVVLAGVVLAALTGVGLALAESRLKIGAGTRKVYGRVLGLGAVALVVAVFAAKGSPWHIADAGWKSFTGPPVQVTSETNLGNRLFSLSSNGRVDIWKEAAGAFAEHPLGGIGAGTFERWWNQNRDSPLKVVDAHSLYLEALAELGPIGLLLMLGLVGVPIAAGIRNRRDPTVPLVLGAFVAFAFHAAVDWDWELAGVTLGTLLVGCALLARARGDNPRVRGGGFRWPALAMVLLVGLFSLFSLVGNRYVARTGGSTVTSALDRADRANAWAPWSPVGWLHAAEVQRVAGDTTGSRESYRAALIRDRGDYLAWLGFAFALSGNQRTIAAKEALRLNPLAPEINSIRPFLGLPPLPAATTAAATTTGAATTTAAATTAAATTAAATTGP